MTCFETIKYIETRKEKSNLLNINSSERHKAAKGWHSAKPSQFPANLT